MEQVKKRSFWVTGLVLALVMSFYGAYFLISGLNTQASSLEALQNELRESGLDQVAHAFALCNRGENQYRDTHTLDGCKTAVLNTPQGSDNSRILESIFQKYEW